MKKFTLLIVFFAHLFTSSFSLCLNASDEKFRQPQAQNFLVAQGGLATGLFAVIAFFAGMASKSCPQCTCNCTCPQGFTERVLSFTSAHPYLCTVSMVGGVMTYVLCRHGKKVFKVLRASKNKFDILKSGISTLVSEKINDPRLFNKIIRDLKTQTKNNNNTLLSDLGKMKNLSYCDSSRNTLLHYFADKVMQQDLLDKIFTIYSNKSSKDVFNKVNKNNVLPFHVGVEKNNENFIALCLNCSDISLGLDFITSKDREKLLRIAYKKKVKLNSLYKLLFSLCCISTPPYVFSFQPPYRRFIKKDIKLSNEEKKMCGLILIFFIKNGEVEKAKNLIGK